MKDVGGAIEYVLAAYIFHKQSDLAGGQSLGRPNGVEDLPVLGIGEASVGGHQNFTSGAFSAPLSASKYGRSLKPNRFARITRGNFAREML